MPGQGMTGEERERGMKKTSAVYRATVLAGIAAIALPTPAWAQDPPGSEEGEDGEYNDVIIVTSERRATNLQDTPLSVVAVTGEIAEAKGIEDLQDLARFTPNLSITPSRGGGNNSAYFTIRGISGGGGATGERGVGLYLDGIYMPRTSGSVLRVLDIDRVEVLRGPQGTLFGRNSTGGAIRIFSQQPSDNFEGYVRGTYGNMDRTDLVATVNVPLAEGVAFRAQGAYLDQDGFVQRGTQELGAERDYIGRAQLRIAPSDRFRATAGFLYNKSESNGTPLVITEFDMGPGIQGVIQGNYGDWLNDAFKAAGQAPIAAYNDPRVVSGDPYRSHDLCLLDDFNPDYDSACDQFVNSEFWQADLNMVYEFNDDVSLTSITGYSELVHEGLTDFQVLGFEQRTENVESKVFYQELQLNAALLDGAIDLVAGGSYFHEDSSARNWIIVRRGTSVFPTAGQQASPTFNINSPAFARGDTDAGLFRTADTLVGQLSDSYGLFLSATWHATDWLNLTGGVRQAWDKKDYSQTRYPGGNPGTPDFTPAPGTTETAVASDADFEALDYRGTIDVHFTDDIMAYATISKAYKAGSFSHTIVSWTAANQATGAAQSALITPIPNEKVINYEAGLRMSLFDRRVTLNPTVFLMDYTNRQAASQVTCGTGAAAGVTPGSPQCPVGFLILVSNQGDVRLKGFELDGRLVLAPGLFLDGGLAITDHELQDPPAGTVNLFPDIPTPTWNVGATGMFGGSYGDVTLNLNYAYVGEQATHPTEGTDSAFTLPGYGLVNARAQWQLPNIPVTVTLFANNLFDKVYSVYGQRFGRGFWGAPGPATGLNAPLRFALSEIRGRPRQVGLTVQYDF
jgi:iron complex outermembrane receptor protein